MTQTDAHVTLDADGTKAVARSLARTLVAGDVLLVHGDLGAGKTVFVKGLAQGLGLDPGVVTSSTFTLVHEYSGGRVPLVHLDLYRVETTALDDVGLDPDRAALGVVVVEWAERLAGDPGPALVVQIGDLGGEAREVRIAPAAPARA